MKQLSIALNILLLVLVGILFYLHFNNKNKQQRQLIANSTPYMPGSRIGYFQMDSLQSNYRYFKEGLNRLKEKEQAMNAELIALERKYQKKASEWQQKGPSMSQSEADAAQKENLEMQQAYQARKQTLD